MTMLAKIKRWYNGERKVATHDSGPESLLMAFTTSHVEYHWSARGARAIVAFYLSNWKWLWTTAIAVLSAITILILE